MLWEMALSSQSQLSSCVSGPRKSMLSQGAPFHPEVTEGGSSWGRRERSCCGRLVLPEETEEAVEICPGSWGRGAISVCPLGQRGLAPQTKLGGGPRPAGGWACGMGASQPWV